MATLEQIEALIVKASGKYSDRVHQWQSLLNIGKSCGTEDITHLRVLIQAIKTSLVVYDWDGEATQKLYVCIEKLVGGEEPEPLPETDIYYGSSSSQSIPTEEEIEDAEFVSVALNSDYTLPLQNLSAGYTFIAEKATQTIKTKWADTVNIFNKGQIGTSSDLFGVPTIVGTYRVYMTEYITEFDNPIKIEK